MPDRLYALVPCAGIGARSGAALPKQYVNLHGQPLVGHTLAALALVERLASTLVVLAPDDTLFEQVLPAFAGPRGWLDFGGGATRAATVLAGLQALQARGARAQDWVLVHDAARCLLRPAWVNRLIDACLDDAVGGLLALPVADTLKSQMDSSAPRVAATLARQGKWAAQTPQMFRIGLLERALTQALAPSQAHAGEAITDESSAIEALGLSPRLVQGSVENFKVTFAADFALAERLLASAPRI